MSGHQKWNDIKRKPREWFQRENGDVLHRCNLKFKGLVHCVVSGNKTHCPHCYKEYGQ